MTSVLLPPRARVRRSPLFMSVVAAVSLAAAIWNSAASVGFPVGAGWERVVNVLVTVDLVVIAAILVVAAVVSSRAQAAPRDARETVLDRDGRPLVPQRIGILTAVGFVLLAAYWILWLATGLPTLIGGLVSGGSAYFVTTVVSAMFGPLWVAGTALAVIGFHRDGSPRNRRFALIAAAMTVAMMAVVVLVAMLFAMGVVE